MPDDPVFADSAGHTVIDIEAARDSSSKKAAGGRSQETQRPDAPSTRAMADSFGK